MKIPERLLKKSISASKFSPSLEGRGKGRVIILLAKSLTTNGGI